MQASTLSSDELTTSSSSSTLPPAPPSFYQPGLKKIAPYWHPYRTMAKQRWWNREILELVSTEFRDRSVEYYRYALESGVTTVNGKVALPGTIVKNGDRIENIVHRHEPPVTSVPVKIIHRDEANEIIVIDKPGSIPVHCTGRYFKNSLVEILQDDFGFEKIYTVNRLDRLTSGCMIIALSAASAKLLCDEFVNGTVKKEYVARCKGKFPDDEITVDEPMLCIDKQMGLNIVHPEGKSARTIFKKLFYDERNNTSILQCRPLTGRSHQIRVHLQYIGYPIANDPVYSDEKVWGPKLGRGGLSRMPSSLRAPPAPPPVFTKGVTTTVEGLPVLNGSSADPVKGRRLLPREDGTDVGMSSPVPLSAEAVGIITKLRNMKDEAEDWSRWRDVIFRAKASLKPKTATSVTSASDAPTSQTNSGTETPSATIATLTEAAVDDNTEIIAVEYPEAAANHLTAANSSTDPNEAPYCPECYLPLHPDPKPDQLFIFLHALRYTTTKWSFATEMPFWAKEEWVWQK